MSDELTPRLNLPLIGDHAQKKLVMNEALMRLESLVQARVLSRTVAAQPVTPEDGDSYILPPSPTGAAWNALAAGTFVRAEGGTWEAVAIPDGAIVHVADEAVFVVRAGGAWVQFESALRSLDNLIRLGIGATADSTNVLTVKGPAALLTALYAAYGGNGDFTLALNKEGTGDTAQVLFQRDYSTRAIIGLLGDNSLTVKVSPDGVSYVSALSFAPATGIASMTGIALSGSLSTPVGSAAAPPVAIGAVDTGWYSSASRALDAALSGVRRLALYESGNLVSLRVGDIDPNLNQAAAFVIRRSGNANANVGILAVSDAAGSPAMASQAWGTAVPGFTTIRGRGTQGAPAYPNSGDTIMNIAAAASSTTVGNAGAVTVADLVFTVQAATPSASDLQSRAVMQLVPAGSVTRSEILRLEHTTGLSMFGANPVIDQNRNVRRRIYTVSGLPSASPAGQSAQVSDAASPAFAAVVSGGGSTATPVYSDGTNWRCG